MSKTKLSTTIIVLLLFNQAFCQSTDSVRKAALNDSRNFRLSEENLLKFKEHRDNASSDLFKPTPSVASSISLLNDSIYVKSFREAAYKQTKKLNAKGEHKRIGVLGYAAAIVFVGLVFLGLNQI